MRRIVIVLAVLLLTTAFVQATDLGFKGGLSLAKFTGDMDDIFEPVASNKAMLTFGGGVFASFPLTPQVCIQPEVLYMMKGTKFDFGELGDLKYKFNYIEVPVLVMYKFPTEGSISPSLFVGPALGILMSAKVTDGTDELDVKDIAKSTDFGLVIGAGMDIKTGEKGKVTFDGRYTLGMTNLNDDVDADVFEFKNSVFSFFVGYAFSIGQ